jgi:hypothetical protein
VRPRGPEVRGAWFRLSDLLISALTGVAASVGLTVAGLWVALRFFGEKLFGHWLNERLQRQNQEHAVKLEKLKGEQNREIEKLRGDIGHLQDRGRRANEEEFSAFRAICDKLEDLFDATSRCVVLYVSAPNLDRMDDEALARFLAENDFTPGEKAALQNAGNRPAAFSRVMALRAVAQAHSAYDDFRAVLDRQSPFIPKTLVDQLRAAGALCPGAIAVRNAEARGRPPPGMTDDLEFLRKRDQVLNDIRDAVRERLQYEDRKTDDA